MSVSKITTEKELAIRRKSAASAPTRPSSMGMTPADVKAIFHGPLLDETDSIKSEINRIVDEVNEGFGDVADDIADINTDMGGKVPTTRKVNGHALDGDVTLTPADLGLVNAYQYRGSVDTYAELPASGMIAGDVYNVVAAHDNYPAGTNYAWNGTAWYIIPQMITGMLNRHPQDAIAVRKTEDKDNYTKFYNHMMND